jgi:hypothetical protein
MGTASRRRRQFLLAFEARETATDSTLVSCMLCARAVVWWCVPVCGDQTGHGDLMQLEEGELERRANVAQRMHKLIECRAPKSRIKALREYARSRFISLSLCQCDIRGEPNVRFWDRALTRELLSSAADEADASAAGEDAISGGAEDVGQQPPFEQPVIAQVRTRLHATTTHCAMSLTRTHARSRTHACGAVIAQFRGANVQGGIGRPPKSHTAPPIAGAGH